VVQNNLTEVRSLGYGTERYTDHVPEFQKLRSWPMDFLAG